MWTPLLRNDSKQAAQAAAAYLSDSRVQHFWDLWSFTKGAYSKQLKTPLHESWDLYVVYKPMLTWRSGLPEPTAWFQNRGLEVGTPFSQEELETALQQWF